MTVGERLRATTQAIDDAMRPVRPLRLPPDPGRERFRGARLVRRSQRWPAWLVPAAAATAIAVVAAALVIVRDLPGTPVKPGGASSPSSAPAAMAPVTDPEALPRYFVALNGPARTSRDPSPPPTGLLIGQTATGQPLAMLAGSATRDFTGVTGAADDRTFVVDTLVPGSLPRQDSVFAPRAFWLLRLVPSATDPTLTRLPIPATPPMAMLTALSLSSDGTKLAVLQALKGTAADPGTIILKVYAIPGGRLLRSWQTAPGWGNLGVRGTPEGTDSNTTLSWTADGRRLAFYAPSATTSATTLREVSLARPGDNLVADSKVIVRFGANAAGYCGSLQLTADGKTVLCATDHPKAHPAPWIGCDKHYLAPPGLSEISLASGAVKLLYEVKPACIGDGSAAITWSSPTGQSLIGTIDYTAGPSMTDHRQAIVITNGKAARLTWPGAAEKLAPDAAAC
jgi:hypothetical protein